MFINDNCSTCQAFSKSIFACKISGSTFDTSTSVGLSMSFKRGQEIYKEGLTIGGVFCVQSGKIKIDKCCGDDRKITIGFAKEGALIGFTGFDKNLKYDNSAICIEDSIICFLPIKLFEESLANNNNVLYNLLLRQTELNRNYTRMIRDLRCKNVRERIASAVLDLKKHFGIDEMEFIDLDIRREDLAQIAGTTVESSIRFINEFRSEKILFVKSKRIRIVDEIKLKQTARYINCALN